MSEYESACAALLRWAKDALVPLSGVRGPEDLSPLGRMIGDASIVALGEGDHFGAEPMMFRNRVLEYLVREKGFTGIALESGIVESRVVYDYVRGGAGNSRDVVSRGISWTFDRAPQNETLVRWLRDYNCNCTGRKVNFYGFDVPGSPGNPQANRGLSTALMEALHYLDRVDSAAASLFHQRVDALVPRLKFDRYRPEAPGYHRLRARERDALTAALADLEAWMQAREARYIAATSSHEYEWALRAAIGARQVDSWLRQIPLDWTGSNTQLRFLDAASDLRDRAQADNLEWVLRQEGPRGKVLVFAHNGHLSTAPIQWTWTVLDGTRDLADGTLAPYAHEVAGTYWRRRFGARLCTIGNLIGEGRIGCEGYDRKLELPQPDALDGMARALNEPSFLLDLREVPAAAASWLRQPRQLGRGFDLQQRYRVSFETVPAEAFDVLVYLDKVTPSQQE